MGVYQVLRWPHYRRAHWRRGQLGRRVSLADLFLINFPTARCVGALIMGAFEAIGDDELMEEARVEWTD